MDAGPQFRAGLDLAGARIGHCADARHDEQAELLEFVVLSGALAADPRPPTPAEEFIRTLSVADD